MADQNTPAEEQTFEQRVTAALDSATAGEDGKLTFAEGTDEAVQYAAMAEKRRRDTQSAFSKSQTSLKALQAENNALAEMLNASSLISYEDKVELEELKQSDPEAWREKLNTLEAEQKAALETKRAEARTKGEKESELERRTRLLDEFNAANPNFALTDEVIADELPPKYVKQLEKGEISFEDFLQKSAEFLGAPKVVQQPDSAPLIPSMSGAGGGQEAEAAATAKNSSASYAKEIY